MSMQVTGQGPVAGAGAQNGRPRVAPTRPGTPESEQLVQVAPPPGTAADATRTVVYADGYTNPSSVTVPELSLKQQGTIQDLEALFQPGGSLPKERSDRLGVLARELGFKDLGMLQHHLRNLSPGQRQNLISSLRTHFAKGERSDIEVVKERFQLAFRYALDELFGKDPKNCLPTPQFVTETEGKDLWDTASLASVYNALASVEQQDPKRFAMVASSGQVGADGKPQPLTFVRREKPEISNPARFMDTMLEAVQIAHADPDNGMIFLYDTAVKGNHRLITDQVVDKLSLISRQDNGSTELRPVYTGGEIQQRKLQRLPNENDSAYGKRLREQLTGDLLKRYGNNDWKRLQEAVNFIIRYKGLDDPAVINKGLKDGQQPKPAMTTVDPSGNPNDPATLAALERLGPSVLMMVACRMEQSDAASQLQGFLRNNLPGSEALAVDGLIGDNTRMMVTSFQTSIALNNLKERIEDDRSLPEAQKQDLLRKFNAYFQDLAKQPDQAQAILDKALVEVKALIASPAGTIEEATRKALVQDLTKMAEVVTGRFNPATANYLVGNWLNVMDSGKGHDLAEQLVVHEVGHIWQHELDKTTGLEVEKNWEQLFGAGHAGHDHAEGDGHTHVHDIKSAVTKMTMGDYHECLQNDNCASSDYGQANAGEDFAEASRLMTGDPARLMRRSLMKFLFVNALSSKPMGAEEITKLADSCGYKPEQLRERLDAFLGRGSNGARFSLAMSTHLQKTYEELRNTLKTASEPVSVSFSHTGARGGDIASTAGSEDLAHLESVAPPPRPQASPSESGYALGRLTGRYRELYAKLGQPGLSDPQKQKLRGQINELDREFASRGPAGFGLEGQGSDSYLKAMAARGYTGDKAAQGHAVVAALAIFRATGAFSRAEHPALAKHLPASFDQLAKDPSLKAALAPGSRFTPTHFLETALDYLKRADQDHSDVNARIGSANLYLTGLGKLIAPICSAAVAAGSSAMNLLTGIFGGSAVSSATTDQLKSAFEDNEVELDSARTQLNQAILILNRAQGSNFPPLSNNDMKQFLLELNAAGPTPISIEKLDAFLLKRAIRQTSSQKPD